MFWKILGVVVLVWIAFAILGALIKALFPILMVTAVIFGLYVLYKALSGSKNKSPLGKF
ncbi:hypothetical protein [Nocardia seriolae]|uniref:DUF2207 domain-containing protein n=1 Tax=Nocardia seriolae TaxID=37332 RepID=A0ABC9YQ58_9NOCA|nr:hypothetical protein [Nocardia seriolae]APB00158.1 hypothetical protein NS506_06121 [Nocardia seriolae]WKY54720.1 hypothetical protein Q5P07_12155 [Nocardia seriolae]BAW08417.1 membrane protein [Nocardia seriolae]BEK89856.1 hypothetical protein NSERKGN1266_58070 [Nocardia seriolae]BEK94527.1 hypothetical protein NSER024013_24330 [Nocardia seriolae]